MTEATLSPATITIANNKLKADDMIMLSGLGELDGCFPIAQVDGNKVTLCDEVDWSDKTLPTDFLNAKAQRIQWSNNFCAVKVSAKTVRQPNKLMSPLFAVMARNMNRAIRNTVQLN